MIDERLAKVRKRLEEIEAAFQKWLADAGRGPLASGLYHPDRFAFHAGYTAAIAKHVEEKK